MRVITINEFRKLQESGEKFQLIDVREPYEYENCNMGGELIPMHEIPHNIDRIQRDIKVVLHCRSGNRSAQIVRWLERYHAFDNLYSLEGGMQAWATEVNPAVLENC